MALEAAKLFNLIVAVGINPTKKCMFTVDERIAMLQETVGDRVAKITSFDNRYLVEYAKSVGAKYIIRGIRNETDYEFERGMRHVNADLDSEVSTIFLMPPRDLAEVSSSMVKAMIGPDGWERVVARYVPGSVIRKLVARR